MNTEVPETEEVIFRRWITVKGRRIYRPDGRPFAIRIKRKDPDGTSNA